MICPNCSTPNDEGFRFCMKCGTPLNPTPAPPIEPEVIRPVGPLPQPPMNQAPQNYPPQGINSQAQTGYSGPAYSQNSGYPSYPQPPANAYNNPYAVQPPYPSGRDNLLLTDGVTGLNIWGPFVEFGTRRRHIGWLMDGKGEQAADLVSKIDQRFRDRQIPNTQIEHQVLKARGIFIESRPYFILRRGLASVALRITQFGKDLFISMASYLKPPISNFRSLVFAAASIISLVMIFIYPSSIGNAFDNYGGSFLSNNSGNSLRTFTTLLCIVGPIGGFITLATLIFLIYSSYKWLVEKDFWAGLRVRPNEFNEDDLMAMEKTVEQTVRTSLDDLGLNPDELKPTNVSGMDRLI